MNKTGRILIVDDEPIIRQMMEALLFREGYDLAFADSGLHALAHLKELDPDVILLDVMMPDLDGYEVCRRLKADAQWQHIPVILVTALEGTEDVVRGLDAGADEFVSKPVIGAELRARVRSMMRIKAQYDTLEEQRQALDISLHLTEKHAKVLELLHEVGLRLMSHLDTDSVLSLIAQAALNLVPAATGCVMHCLSGDEQHLLPVVLSPENGSNSVHIRIGVEDIARQAIVTRTAIYVPDVLADPHLLRPELPDLRAFLVTPLVNDQQPIGALSVYSPTVDAFDDSHRRLLSILTNQATVALAKAQYFEQRDISRQREKEAIRGLFQRYVSPSVVNRLIEGQEKVALGGTCQPISVLFADIRGFSTFSENREPESLIKVLNQYFTLAVEAILAQDGTLDKFMGDAVMAIFNAPLPQPDHTLRAVRAAMAMQKAIFNHNLTVGDNSTLNFNIGIHMGPAVVGNIGSVQLMNYTAVGDTVNLAKRLQENARDGQIILSQSAYEMVKDVATVQDLGFLAVKGRAAPEHSYALLGMTD